MTFIEGAVVAGWPAHVLSRILARHISALVADPRLSAAQRADLESVRADILKAARRWETSISSADISEETHEPEILTRSELISTDQASLLLGVTPRRARQIAASGLGVKVRGAWLLDRAAVEQYRQERRTSGCERPEGRSPHPV